MIFQLKYKRWSQGIHTGECIDRFHEIKADTVEDAERQAQQRWGELKQSYIMLKFVGLFQVLDWKPEGE